MPTYVTVGYGPGGFDPIEYALPDGKPSNTGFLKAFVSTKWVDMGWMTRSPPSTDILNSFPAPPGGAQAGSRKEDQDAGVWDAYIAAVTIKQANRD